MQQILEQSISGWMQQILEHSISGWMQQILEQYSWMNAANIRTVLVDECSKY